MASALALSTAHLCRALSVPRSTFYRHNSPPSALEMASRARDASLRDAIQWIALEVVPCLLKRMTFGFSSRRWQIRLSRRTSCLATSEMAARNFKASVGLENTARSSAWTCGRAARRLVGLTGRGDELGVVRDVREF
jgi:hypothetical protein